MTRRPNTRNKRRVLLSMTGAGIRDGWITLKLPAWLVVFLVVIVLAACVAVVASPELAAELAAFLARWLHVSSSPRG
jgi:hypothetical protein